MAFRSHALGTWVPLGIDPDTGEQIRLKLRPIPPSLHLKINRRHGYRENASPDVVSAIIREKARYALLDSEHFSIVLESHEDGEEFSKALGSEVEIGEPLSLDGRWNAAVADVLFERVPIQVKGVDDEGKPRSWPLDFWIIRQADKLGAIEGEREEALGKA